MSAPTINFSCADSHMLSLGFSPRKGMLMDAANGENLNFAELIGRKCTLSLSKLFHVLPNDEAWKTGWVRNKCLYSGYTIQMVDDMNFNEGHAYIFEPETFEPRATVVAEVIVLHKERVRFPHAIVTDIDENEYLVWFENEDGYAFALSIDEANTAVQEIL